MVTKLSQDTNQINPDVNNRPKPNGGPTTSYFNARIQTINILISFVCSVLRLVNLSSSKPFACTLLWCPNELKPRERNTSKLHLCNVFQLSFNSYFDNMYLITVLFHRTTALHKENWVQLFLPKYLMNLPITIPLLTLK